MSLATWQSAAPAFQFEASWRILPGMGHGCRQPILLGTARVSTGLALDLARLDQAMAQWVAEPAPAAVPGHPPAFLLAMRVLHWACAVQRQCNVPLFSTGSVWRAAHAAQSDLLRVAMPYAAAQASQSALAWAEAAVSALLAPDPRTPQSMQGHQQAFDQLTSLLQGYRLQGVNPFRFLKAAAQLDLPVRRVSQDVFCFGTGRGSRWLESSYTDTTSVVGTRIARDKTRTAQVLRQAGIPAAVHARAESAEQAVALAHRLEYPVVVKPADRDQGLGVAADLRSDAAVVAAYHEAARHSDHILVEKHFAGKDYRLTVLNGRLIKTIVRVPGGVTGDGIHSVAELVQQASQDAQQLRRSRERGQSLLALDPEALDLLAENGQTPATVPARGHHVSLRRRANVSAGGTPQLVTTPIHPDNRRLAERAVAALRLDLAGVDLIMPDISRSWMDTGALVCEVNGQPQIGSSTSPAIYQDILRQLLPPRARMPVGLVIAGPDAFDMPTAPNSPEGVLLGRACTQGIWQGGERLAGAQASSFGAAQILMANQDIDAALVAMAPAHILLQGLPFDRCDIVVLAGPGSGPAWSAAELAGMWSMLLPHVAREILVPGNLSHFLPDNRMLDAHGLCVVQGPADAHHAAIRLLVGSGGTVCALPDPQAAAPESTA